MSGDWLHMCTYMVHWIPPFPGKWEIFCDNMIGSHLFRFMGAAHGIIIAIYQEARWWIIARFGFLTYSWFVRATRIMICVCVWFCSKSIYLKLWQLCSLVSFDLFGSVWPIAATNTPSSSRLRFGLFGQQKEVLFSYTCFHSCPGQQQGWTLSSPGKSKQRFKMNIHPPKTNMDTQNDGLENDFPF